MSNNSQNNLRSLLSPPKKKAALDAARAAGQAAAERLWVAGRERDIIILERGKHEIMVQDYGRSEPTER